MNNNNLSNKFDFIIIITIASLAWGSYELLGAFTPIRVIGLYGFYCAHQNRKILHQSTFGLAKLFYLWILYSLLSLVLSFSFSSWLIQFCHTSTMMGAIMVLVIWGEKASNPLKSVSYGWMLFVLITMPIALWELSTGNHLTAGSFNDDTVSALGMLKPFAAVTFVNYNSYVVLLCIAAPFILNLLFNGNKIDKIISILVLVFIFIILAFNTSRGGIICFVISIILFFLLKMSQVNKLSKIALTISLIWGIHLFVVNSSELEILEPLTRRSGSIGIMEDNDRVIVWLHSLIICVKYFFLGTGCGSMPHVLGYYYHNQLNFCHNYFLETLLEYGFLISVIWFVKLFGIIRNNIISPVVGIKYVGLYALMSSPFLFIIDDYYAQRTGIWLYVASLLVLYNYSKRISVKR